MMDNKASFLEACDFTRVNDFFLRRYKVEVASY